MSEEKYYLVSQSGDGDIYIEAVNLKELTIKMDEWVCEESIPIFLDSVKNNNDPMYWPENSLLIIEGKIVVPKIVEKIKKLEL